jgi:hypothetical protein
MERDRFFFLQTISGFTPADAISHAYGERQP